MPEIKLDYRFSSSVAEAFFNCSKRNILWVSGYGAGKTYAACQKIVALLCKFPGYRVAIGRYAAADLRRTTVQTFFKVCPPELYSEKYGGKRVDSLGYVDLINKSRVYFMHFDQYDESALRSLEVNAVLLDQAEEVQESVYLTLDSRVGRWDEVTIPDDVKPFLPVNTFTGKVMAPAYTILLANPPDEGEFSYLWQRYHPDSQDFKDNYKDTHAYFQSASGENKALPPEVLKTMMSRDPEWVKRYVYGNFSRGEGAIHDISPLSYIEVGAEMHPLTHTVTPKWIEDNIIKRGVLSRALDHGASAPTACTWWTTLKGGIHVCYREYYQPNAVVSQHRKRIAELSRGEVYSSNLADPSIFKKTLEKYGGHWTVADEYSDDRLATEQLFWSPADNNEFGTRNRINEYLQVDPELVHPVSGIKGCPRILFIRRSPFYPFGCYHLIKETMSQKKELLDTVNGRNIYGDEREPSIADHAYDTMRYKISAHLAPASLAPPSLKPNSFAGMMKRMKALKVSGYMDKYGVPK